MKTTVVAVIVTLLVCGDMAVAQQPRTVDEAVQTLKSKWLKPKDREFILRNPKKFVWANLYMGFGTSMRNEFGLWRGNQNLRDSCGTNDPEGCSSIIIDRLWDSVRSDADPKLVRQLDCQFHLIDTIQINYAGFHKLTTGDLLKAIQSQIDDQMTKLASGGLSPCQSSLKVEVEGDPDMRCFVDASFVEPQQGGTRQSTTTNLDSLLGWMSFRNFFTPAHVPPKLVFRYSRKCQFATPPYLYGKRH